MKQTYIQDLWDRPVNADVHLLGWLKARRSQGGIIFLDVCDSTGNIQIVVNRSLVDDAVMESANTIPVESAVEIRGRLAQHHQKLREIVAQRIVLVGSVERQVSPQPRGDFDIFDPALANHLLNNRHIYLRNPKIMAILRFRSVLMTQMRRWFEENGYLEINAPILTPVPLYDDSTAIPIVIHGEQVYVTQCVGYYLEAAAHAFERVYNMGPSFRGEESRSRRHLIEYWHIKAELAFSNLEDIIKTVEDIIKFLTQECWRLSDDMLSVIGTNMCLDGLEIPFARISYEEAISRLQSEGVAIEFGKSLGSEEEEMLSRMFTGPFWITGIPRVVEPFPYVIDSTDTRITRVADLIASNGYGELLGVAEKIHDLPMLDERLEEKGKRDDARYEWIREIHQLGCVPHTAFGMGVERLIRWLLNIPHVRDAIPFPRVFRRRIMP